MARLLFNAVKEADDPNMALTVTSSTATSLLLHYLNSLAYNLNEIGFDTGPTHECAVDVGMGHELADVVGGNAAAVEDAYGCGCPAAIQFTIQLTDALDDLPDRSSSPRDPR